MPLPLIAVYLLTCCIDFGLTRLSQIPQSASFKTSAVLVLTLDGNRLSTLDGLEEYENVVQVCYVCTSMHHVRQVCCIMILWYQLEGR